MMIFSIKWYSRKSTLINSMLGQKIAITSPKPQTTRTRVRGILNRESSQIVFVDTPGFHQGHKRALNKYMNRVALNSIEGVDIVLFMIESLKFDEEDNFLLKQIFKNTKEVILVINKIDKTTSKNDLLPFIRSLSESFNFAEIVPISALKKTNIEDLEQAIILRLPKGKHLYQEDQVTDKTERFLASEIIREKCITRVGDEIPYRLAVVIDQYYEEKRITHIVATLFVEKNSQKGIVIGKNGKRLKAIGTAARKDLENMLKSKVMLRLWVKVKKDWTDNKVSMNTMGYEVA